jgi:crotonobetainyl-CoA:carnitine CoA-transferase CaiB-like acyl-CoA transferase
MTEALTAAFARPLDGVRIIDMSTYLAGPLGAKMLSDLGADVIKVEMPDGDPYRYVGPMRDGTSIYWLNGNNGKKGVTIDLKTPGGLDQLKKLLATADILIENSKPQVTAKLGLGPEAVQGVNPQLIRLSITGYGPDGPLSSEPVYDALLQGRTGLLAFEAGKGGVPRATNCFLADKIGATFVCQMALAGLVARGKTGKGMHLQGSMLDIMSYYNFPDMLQHRTFLDDERDWNAPPQVVVPTKDGYMVLSPVTGKQLSATLEVLGHLEWKTELREIKDSRQRTYRFFEMIEEPLRAKTTAEWLPIFRAAEVPVAPVNDPEDGLKDDQVIHNEIYFEMETPLGKVRAPRYPMTIDGQKLIAKGPAPALGQDNEAFL